MYSFLFDYDHLELKDLGLIGPPCTQRVVRALESLDPIPTTRLLRGKVLPEHGCYHLAHFRIGGAPTEIKKSHHLVRTDSFRYEPDDDLFKIIVCDLAETLAISPSTVDEDAILLALARGSIWAIGASITDEEAFHVDAEVRAFGPYLGMTKLDLGNPTHRSVMVENMYRTDIVLGPTGILYEAKPYLPVEDQRECLYLAESHGSSKPPIGLEWEEFQAALPPLSIPETLSERGELSLGRIAGKGRMSHRERLARALLDRFKDRSDHETLEFSTALDQGVRDFEFDPRKFTEYLLNTGHPTGGGKAKFFVDLLEIDPQDWRFLADQIERGITRAPIYRVGKNPHGFTHGALVLVTGRNGKEAVLETGWIFETGSAARFVTAYPFDGQAPEEIARAEPFVVAATLEGDERWSAIYDVANAAAKSAAEAVQPVPMLLEGHKAIWEGMCGFGWVQLPNARQPMAKWLLKLDKGSWSHPGVIVWSRAQTQSLDRNRAWAEAFADVLLANGVECVAKSRID